MSTRPCQSTTIHVTNLPSIFGEFDMQERFRSAGQIVAVSVSKGYAKSTGFVQFASSQSARHACSSQDQTVIDNAVIRVYLVWTKGEDLSTLRVRHYPAHYTETQLSYDFEVHGDIIDITLHDDHALISFSRVDYALVAAKEMKGAILGNGGSLEVELVNADAKVKCILPVDCWQHRLSDALRRI